MYYIEMTKFAYENQSGKISTEEAYSILERGIERMIPVYDMDHLNGDKTKILEVQTLEKRIKDMKQLFKQLVSIRTSRLLERDG